MQIDQATIPDPVDPLAGGGSASSLRARRRSTRFFDPRCFAATERSQLGFTACASIQFYVDCPTSRGDKRVVGLCSCRGVQHSVRAVGLASWRPCDVSMQRVLNVFSRADALER